jgi:hypothetical protein
MGFKEQPFFVYEKLQLSQPSFRLCRIISSDVGGPLCCELVHRLLSETTTSYAALSYTWGEPSEQRWIKVNGRPFHVQPNLYAALHAIRPTEGDLWLWVDALCINQKDIPERNNQVALMGDIYRNASEVRSLAWPSFWRQRRCLRRDLLSETEAEQWESRNGFRFTLQATVLVACLDMSGASPCQRDHFALWQSIGSLGLARGLCLALPQSRASR